MSLHKRFGKPLNKYRRYHSRSFIISAIVFLVFFCHADVFSQENSGEKTSVNAVDPAYDPADHPMDDPIPDDEGQDKSQEDKEDNAEEKSKGDLTREEYDLEPITVTDGRPAPWKKQEIQGISRQTMTIEDLKEVPSSFGDSINALTSLPGIIRAGGGIFGPLVIRGADMATNRYFIDDIPINDPLHFGGLHSVINTNLMSDIDVYSSSFPAEFGSAASSVIDISTRDSVEEFGGYSDISLLSAATLVMTPILREKDGNLLLDGPSHKSLKGETENAGYIIASGRYGYVSLAIKAAELITGEESPIMPEYWDFQLKIKYRLNRINSATLLYFGHSDFLRFDIDEDFLEEGDDPLYEDMKLRSDVSSHNLGLYIDSGFSDDFSNRFLAFAEMPDTYFYYNLSSGGAASWAKDLNGHYRPGVYSVKDKFSKYYLSGRAELRGALEYSYYHFTAKGKTIIPLGVKDYYDPADENAYDAYEINERITNNLFGGYLENRFDFGGATAVLGIRSEYLARMEDTTSDPRFMLSYSFSRGTTISAAGGRYSYFFQTNPNYFNSNPDLAKLDRFVKPEKARHLSLGVQQETGLYTVKLEGFNNYFYNKPEPYPHYEADGTYLQGLNSGEAKAHGFEIMIRKDTKEDENGIFGWASYTYTRSREKTGLPTTTGYAGVETNPIGDIYGDKWTTSGFEQRHSLKFTGGYKFRNHTWSGRFQYYTGFPYTPYIDGVYDADYNELTGEDRYYPVTGSRNSKKFPAYYSLDVRYAKKKKHSWGYLSWYVEVINALMKKATNNQKWNYDRAYEKGRNPEISEEEGFASLFNFGIEAKF